MVARTLLRLLFPLIFGSTVLAGGTASKAQTVQELLDQGYADLAKASRVWFGNAHAHFFEAWEQAKNAGDQRGEARARLALGRLRIRAADGVGALAYFELARELYRSLGDPRGEAEAEHGIGEAYSLLGMLEEAQSAFEGALALEGANGAGAASSAVDLRSTLARTYTARGAYDEAIGHLVAALEVQDQADDPKRLREVALRLGNLYHRVGRYSEAREAFRRAEEALESDGAEVDAEAIRAFFRDLYEAGSNVFGLVSAINRQDLDAQAPNQVGIEQLLSLWFGEEPPPTLARDPAFKARRLALGRDLPLGSQQKEEFVLTPRIRQRVVTSYRIFEPLIRDCSRLHEAHQEQVAMVTNRLRGEIPGLAKFKECSALSRELSTMTREERRKAAEEHAYCSDGSWVPSMMGAGPVGFWDLEPDWPADCGEQEEDVFDPQAVEPRIEEDAETEQRRDMQESMEEQFPELKTQSIDEVIAQKEKEIGSINLSFKGGFFKNLKDSVVDSFKGPFELMQLRFYKLVLDLQEQGFFSEMRERMFYIRLSGGFFFMKPFEDVEEQHQATIQGMCRQAFETELRDSLSLTLTELGPNFAEEAQAADALAWKAQEPLWGGMSYMGLEPEAFGSMRETLTPSLVFEDCTEEGRVSLNLRRLALWRGQVSLQKGEFPLAIAFFHGAWKGGLGIVRKSEPELEIEALMGLGEAYEGQGYPALAAIYYQEALGFVESIQGSLRQESMTMSFADAQTELYGRMVDLLVEMGEEEFTFEYAGRARARAFLDLIGNERLELRGVPQKLSAEWNATRAELLNVQSQEREIDPFVGGAERRELKKRQAELEVRLEELQNLIRKRHPQAASWVSMEPPPLENLSAVAVEPGTSIVVYFLSPKRLLAWVIEPGSTQQLILEAERSKIEAQVEEVRREIASRQTPEAVLEELYRVLFAPLVPKLSNQKLIVVPYGTLHQLPFAALRDPATGRYLVEDYQLTLLPSASVVTYVQKRRNPWTERVLAVGNPDGSLPQADQEARNVAAFYRAEPLVGPAADEEAVRQAAGQLDVLHLAAHGRFQEERPLFGYVALAGAQNGDPRNDGRLEVLEVLNEIDLEGSNLVVLSACNSSVGRRNRGDDIVGMPRAMLYAGTPAVVSTLWSIDDEAAQQLMTHFHRHLQTESAGAAEALRAAQIELLQEEATAPPYFWAGFTLSGDHESRGVPPQPRPGAENPWTYDPAAEVPPAPPPLVAERPAILPWSRDAQSTRSTPFELAAEAGALLDDKWLLGSFLAYPKLLQAMEGARRTGDRRAEAAARVGLGRLRAWGGDIAGGLAHLQLAEEIYLELEDVEGMATAQEGLAEAWRAWGALPRSRRAFEDALELRAVLESDHGELDAKTHEDLAEVLELDGAYGSALGHLNQARELWRGLGQPHRAFEAGVKAGELVASLNREDRSVEILEAVLGEMRENPGPGVDPAEAGEILGDLDALSRAQAARMASWLAYAWSEDPFADWPDPPTTRDKAFVKRRQKNLGLLPDFLADLGEAPRVISPIHGEFALSVRLYMRLIRDCAHLHGDYSAAQERVRKALGGAATVRADWPDECGPGQTRFDPRHVWHTAEGVAPDHAERQRGLAAWRSESQGVSPTETARETDRGETAWGRVEEQLETTMTYLRPLAWAMGRLDEDPSVLLSDKKVVYHLLGSTSAPLPERMHGHRQRSVAVIDALCRQNLEVRASNALWRSYTRLGSEYADEAQRAREAAWQAARPLWRTWLRLGWVEGSWEVLRDSGLPAPVLGSCESENRGFIDPHEVLLWRGHASLAQGQLTLARVWYGQAAGSRYDWLKPRTGTKVSALLGLAEVYRREGRLGLATIRYRDAIALIESVAEGLRRAELMAPAVDVEALYETLNARLAEMGEDGLVFEADLRDGTCPDWLEGSAPLPETVPQSLVTQREALCLDLVAVQNRETVLRGDPFTIGGYQGAGNSLARLRSQRIWLQNAIHALDYEIRWPSEEERDEEIEASLADGASVGELPLAGDSSSGLAGRIGGGVPRSNLIDTFKRNVISKLTDKVEDLAKKGMRWARRKLSRKKNVTNQPPPEEVLGVTLYEKRDFQGPNESFGQDDPSLKDNPLGHDYARSVKVDPGCIVTLYEGENYAGPSTVLRADTPRLKDEEVGEDEISSLKVRCR